MMSTDTRGEIEAPVTRIGCGVMWLHSDRDVPIPSMCLVSFRLSVLNHDWESHYNRASQCDSLVDQIDGTKLDISNPIPLCKAYLCQV